MSSTSAAGVSIVTLQFNLGLALDVAEQQVQAAINAGASLLPADLPAPPVYAKVNPADAPVLTLADHVGHLAAHRGAEHRQHAAGAEDQPGLRRRAGHAVGRPAAGGADPGRHPGAGRRTASAWTRCARRSPRPTPTAPRAASTGRRAAYTINSNDQLLTAADYGNLIVAYQNGAPVRLSDVAQRGRERRERQARRLGDDGRPALAGHHPRCAAPARRQRHRHRRRDQGAACPNSRRACRAAVHMDVLSDRTTGIRASVDARARSSWCWRCCWWCW